MRSIAQLVACLMIGLGGQSVRGAEIVILGDSWAKRIALALRDVAAVDGVTVSNKSLAGLTAESMVGDLTATTSRLNSNRDAKVVHLSIGGNDFLNNWNSALTAGEQASLFAAIVDDVETVVGHINQIRPDVSIFHLGYDFPRPLPIGTPLQVNQAALTLANSYQPVLASNYTYFDFYGLTQIEYGIPELGLPPGDPSLPRIDQPGPEAAYDDRVHLTPEAYQLFAERSYARYRVLLVPEPSSAGLLIVVVGVCVMRRRSGY